MDTSRIGPLAVFLLLAVLVYPVQRWIDASSSTASIENESLYLTNGVTVRKLSLGYDAALADVYWMRLVQYFGRKVIDDPSVLAQRSEKLALLYPLTDIVTDLDPRYVAAYRFGGFFVHDYVDPVRGFSMLNKAIKNNPEDTSLYQDLAFLYWSDGRCQEAADTYLRGAQVPHAPGWMRSLAATVLADCGDVTTAREMYLHMLDTATDPRIRTDVERKIVQLQATDDIAAIEAAIAKYKAQTGQVPSSLGILRQTLSATPGSTLRFGSQNLPLDPNGVPYIYDPSTGTVTPDPTSLTILKLTIRKSKDS